VRLGDKGLDREGNAADQLLPGEAIEAKVTVFGGRFNVANWQKDVVKKKGLDSGRHPIRSTRSASRKSSSSRRQPFRENHVVTPSLPLGQCVRRRDALPAWTRTRWRWPSCWHWTGKYADLTHSKNSSVQVAQVHPPHPGRWRGHCLRRQDAARRRVLGLPASYHDGALIVGDAAGFTDVRKLKGWHNAMRSGLLAGEAILPASSGTTSARTPCRHTGSCWRRVDHRRPASGEELRQMFTKGGTVYLGAPVLIQGLIRRR